MDLKEQEMKPEQLHDQIDRNVYGIELEFVFNQHQKFGGDILETLEKYSDLFFSNQEDQGNFLSSIKNISVDDQWRATVLDKFMDIKKQKEIKQKQENLKTTEHLGLFTYNLENLDVGNLHKIMNIPDGETVLELHLPTQIVEKAKGVKANLIDSMVEIAKYIITKHPEITCVAGRSWLMSRPDVSQLGFEKINIPETEVNNNSCYKNHGWWLQLVDKNGKIREDRKKQLLDHGTMPFEFVYGKIDTVDLLKKYLPNEMRGEITLKKLDPQNWSEYCKTRNETTRLKENFSSMNLEKLTQFMDEQMPAFRSTVKDPLFNRLVSCLKKSREEGKSLEEAMKSDPDLFKEVEALNENLRKSCYQPYTIKIE